MMVQIEPKNSALVPILDDSNVLIVQQNPIVSTISEAVNNQSNYVVSPVRINENI
jgi:hypothetical protein